MKAGFLVVSIVTNVIRILNLEVTVSLQLSVTLHFAQYTVRANAV